MKKIILTVASLGIISCSMTPSKPTFDTPSGGPEVTIERIERKVIIGELVNRLINDRYVVKSVSEHQAVVGKPSDSSTIDAFYGSRFNPKPEIRAYYTFTDTMVGEIPATRVVAIFQIVINPGSGFERVSVANWQGYHAKDAQKQLIELKQLMEKRP